MSFAPKDTHEAQVQFALERGVPALIGIMASIRLPYPARAFDMAHCSRCLIPWGQYGIYSLDLKALVFVNLGSKLLNVGLNLSRWSVLDRSRSDFTTRRILDTFRAAN